MKPKIPVKKSPQKVSGAAHRSKIEKNVKTGLKKAFPSY